MVFAHAFISQNHQSRQSALGGVPRLEPLANINKKLTHNAGLAVFLLFIFM